MFNRECDENDFSPNDELGDVDFEDFDDDWDDDIDHNWNYDWDENWDEEDFEEVNWDDELS